MAYEVPLVRGVIGNTIRISAPVIPPSIITYTSASNAAGDTTLTVADNFGLSQNDYVLVGKVGFDATEIVQITGAVTQGTSVTVGALVYVHPVDTPVQKILWNQVEISGAATATGSKTVIATIALQPDRSETTYVNTGTTYAFYFARFKNTQTTTFSAYSDSAPAGGYSTNTIRAAKDTALSMVNEKISDFITDAFLNQEIFNCEQEVWSERKKWSWAYTFDNILGQLSQGAYSLSLPTDISDTQSNKGVLPWDAVHISTIGVLRFMTKEEMDLLYINSSHTTLVNAINLNDATITLTNSNDFPSSGSVLIGANTYSYTANNTSTGVLTLSVVAATTNVAGADVWTNMAFGQPNRYSIYGNKIYFDVPADSTTAGKNVYMNYYRKPTSITTDDATLNIPDFTIYHYYLAWKILLRKNNGSLTEETKALYDKYAERKKILGLQDRIERSTLRPRLNTMKETNVDPFIQAITISGTVTQL